MPRLLRPLAPLAVLVGLTLVFGWRLAFTDWILARGDTFAYFYPYWHVRDSALAAGRLPLWTPDLFMGVPLLANSQLGTFYPPNWMGIALSPPDGVRLSILIHLGWALIGTYALARRALALDTLPALLAAVLFGLGGYVGAHVEQINQLQGLAWMPWLFLAYHAALRRPAVYIPLLAMGLALQFFSGHSQTVFITLIGLGIYGVVTPQSSPLFPLPEREGTGGRELRGEGLPRLRALLILALAALVMLPLALPQLAPTLELTQHSNRRGGLNPNQATAFSFSPLVIGRGLLPNYDLPIFGEYVAYVGVIGLGLAVMGVVQTPPLHPSPNSGRGRGGIWLILALVGIVLALGLYNPLYWTLATLPGFNLFRVPARWLALFALGTAVLAGLGLQALIDQPSSRRRAPGVGLTALVVGVLAVSSALATRIPEGVPMSAPEAVTLVGWAAAGAVFALIIVFAKRLVGAWRAMPLLAVLIELFAASQVLPYQDLAPPEAYHAQRFTISQLRAYQEEQTTPGRVLSISNLYFDPGDRAALEARYGALGMSARQIAYAFDAIKMKETLAANLPLAWGVPSIDGFDGGLLPTSYYTAFTSLLLPPDTLRTVDGRLREILARPDCRGACIPDGRWLNLTNTRYLITDKIYDLWHEDVAYDTQFEAFSTPDAPLRLTNLPRFEADALDVLYSCSASPCLPPVVTFIYADGHGAPLTTPDAAPTELDGYLLARWTAANALTPSALEIASAVNQTVRALTLVDRRTGAFVQLPLGAWRRALSSDIKLYENLSVLPRAFVVQRAEVVADDDHGTEDALALMRAPDFDPAQTVIIAGSSPVGAWRSIPSRPESQSSAAILSYTPESIEIAVSSAVDGFLMLTDAWYPGWSAEVNGKPTPVYRADVMFRAVAIPAGDSRVVFTLRPVWLPGALAGGALAWLAAALRVLTTGLQLMDESNRTRRIAPNNGLKPIVRRLTGLSIRVVTPH